VATPSGNDEVRAETSKLVATLDRLSPYWAPQLVVAVAILLDLALAGQLTIGPRWLLPAVEGGLLIALVMILPHPRVRHTALRRYLSMGFIGLVSAVNAVSLGLLVHYLLHGHTSNGRTLVYSGIVLWVTNVLLFGLWYWELDRGGPVARREREHAEADFLFPQMTAQRWAPKGWIPGLIDYLYTSFTNASAFSPTDTMPLTATAKWLMAAQASIALVTIGLVVARAVNILS
jgi:hypothetical protein